MFEEELGNCLDNLAESSLWEMLNSAELCDTFKIEDMEECYVE